ncbi:MAG TPA: TetR/AcrR family transcriptional regulator [Candidatus Cryptobacteroides excrementigallinarum]|nr:TetR/AcrR family transcriptional regulator [Candidatus Cryptobacteroides excrementigallinarum]
MMTKEQEILLAASEEFFEKGYDGTSTAVIARKAGVTHAMVNYYFRTKEQLFLKILDDMVYDFVQGLKPVMHGEGDFLRTILNAASAIFDCMDRHRRLPFIIMDLARNHPELLDRYLEFGMSEASGVIAGHSERLAAQTAAGIFPETSIYDILDTVLTLASAPFRNIPLLENVLHFTSGQIEDYLQARKREMLCMLERRYSLQPHRRADEDK